MPDTPATPRSAATLILLRDGMRGLETLMIERHAGLRFAPGALVFPGGCLCDDDHAGGADGDLPLRMAAIRECFEECGILLARRRDDSVLIDAGPYGMAHGAIPAPAARGGSEFQRDARSRRA